MNSLLPTDKQHDAHFAHVCVDCGTPFSKHVPKAGDCEDGDLCRDCLDAREHLTKDDNPLLTHEEVNDCIRQSGENYCQACGTEWKNHRHLCSGSMMPDGKLYTDS